MKLKRLALGMAAAGVMALSVAPAQATLTLFQKYDNAALSVDGFGGTSGQLQADVAAGSTIVAAYLYSSSIWNNSALSPIMFGGTLFNPASGTTLAPNVNPATTVRYDVTSIVAPVINGGAGGIYNFSISENGDNDGETLVVVYGNASTAGGAAILLDGELATTGDTTTLTFGATYAGGNLFMSLADSFSYNGGGTTDVTGQVTTIDVLTNVSPLRRLTSCAGGNDDGLFANANGTLLTAGGVGDNPANPLPTCAGGAGDDEFYNLALGNASNASPFLANGANFVTFNTVNPSNDDNIYGLFFSSTFGITQVGPGPGPTGPLPVPEPATLALTGLALAGLAVRRKQRK